MFTSVTLHLCVCVWHYILCFSTSRGLPGGSEVKRLPAMQETWVWSLGWEDPLEKEMVTHSIILAWRIPWTEKPGRLQSTGSQRVEHDWATSHTLTHSASQFSFHLTVIVSCLRSFQDFVRFKKKYYNDILIHDTKSYFANPCQFINKTKKKKR